MAPKIASLEDPPAIAGTQGDQALKRYFLYKVTLNAPGGLVQQTVQIVARFAHTI
jgi:hypothetical protein